MQSLEIYNINKKIKEKHIINNIGFKIKEGNIYGIVGPNGSGKTSLLKTITNLYKKDSGIIIFNGKPLIKKDFEKISSIIETPKFYENLTGRDNLELISLLYEDICSIDDIIEKLNMKKYIDKKVKLYSLGMKQKLGVCSILINNPKVLILDEPTNGFDPSEVLKFKNLLKKLDNKIILICTHDLDLVASLCDEVLFIKSGRMIDIVNAPFGNRKKLESLFMEESNVKIIKI